MKLLAFFALSAIGALGVSCTRVEDAHTHRTPGESYVYEQEEALPAHRTSPDPHAATSAPTE